MQKHHIVRNTNIQLFVGNTYMFCLRDWDHVYLKNFKFLGIAREGFAGSTTLLFENPYDLSQKIVDEDNIDSARLLDSV